GCRPPSPAAIRVAVTAQKPRVRNDNAIRLLAMNTDASFCTSCRIRTGPTDQIGNRAQKATHAVRSPGEANLRGRPETRSAKHRSRRADDLPGETNLSEAKSW